MKIRVDNISDSDVVTYSTPLLTGEIEDSQVDGLLLVSLSSDPDEGISWPVVEGHFKVLVRLEPGENTVNLQFNQECLSIRLRYEIPGFTHIVRPVYLVCADDDGYFQGPESIDCSPTSAIQRISFGAEIIQTLTAEKMKEHGFGRMTFQLEMDSHNLPVCHVFKSKLTLEEAYSMTGYQLWSYFGKELTASPLFPYKCRSKFYCFMSFTRYHLPKDEDLPKTHSDILRHTKGHTALGGGSLALFGTGNLHTWADSLATFNSCLTNRTRMDRRKFMDDSAYREYYWANYATGLGASLHELGHTFDLAHTPSGIMGRGFDDLHKVFTIQQRRKGRRHHRSEHQQRQRYNSGGSSNSETSRTPSTSSIDDTSSSLGSSYEGPALNVSADMAGLHAALRRQSDVCYGSPCKQYTHTAKRCFYKVPPQTCTAADRTYIVPPPLVVRVEPGCQQSTTPRSLNMSVKNYDGSERNHTTTEGDRSSVSSTAATSSSSLSAIASTLPKSPDELSSASEVRVKQEIHCSNTGAHWHRSSAVVLRFHKWFNKPSPDDTRKNPTIHGACVRAQSGLRIIELRTDPDGCVIHHWEFLGSYPPTDFKLYRSEVRNMPAGASAITIMAEDSYGNIMKKKFHVKDFL